MSNSVTFKSKVNGIKFDSVNGTTSHLLASHKKSDFVQAEQKVKPKGKAKIVVNNEDHDDDNEQEIS